MLDSPDKATMSITVVDSDLRLVRIPKEMINACMWHIHRCTLFRDNLASHKAADPFFSITSNAVELSIFGNRDLIDNVFGNAARLNPHMFELSKETWYALQVENHHEDFEHAGSRLRDVSAPLANAGISIYFLSTYHNDFLLVQQQCSDRAFQILSEALGFRRQYTPEELRRTPSRSHSDGANQPTFDLERSLSQTSEIDQPLMRSMTGSFFTSGHTSEAASPVRSLRSPEPSEPSLSRHGSLNRQLSTGSRRRVEEPNSPSMLTRLAPTMSPNRSRSSLRHPEFFIGNDMTASAELKGREFIVLPDELACVGLSKQHESIWRARLTKILFYSDDVLKSGTAALEGSAVDDTELSTTARENRFEQLHIGAKSRQSSTSSYSDEVHSSTAGAEKPIPFFSYTETSDGTSMIADLRILRLLFPEEDSIEMIYGDISQPYEAEESDEEDWQVVPEGQLSSRKILKCLQLDLTNVAIDRAGIASKYAEILTAQGINLLYASTLRSANLIVAKVDLRNAIQALDENVNKE